MILGCQNQNCGCKEYLTKKKSLSLGVSLTKIVLLYNFIEGFIVANYGCVWD